MLYPLSYERQYLFFIAQSGIWVNKNIVYKAKKPLTIVVFFDTLEPLFVDKNDLGT